MSIPLAKKALTEIPTVKNDTISLTVNNSVDYQDVQQAPPVPILTNADNPIGDISSTVKNTNVNWINNRWRPAMAWLYLAVCACDFMLYPVLWSILQAVTKGAVTQEWQPLTLQGAGLFHLAMGAILGITAYGRSREKLAGVSE